MTDATTAQPSNAKTIKEFFGVKPGQTASGFISEFKELSDEDKKQLGDGIRNGSLTY